LPGSFLPNWPSFLVRSSFHAVSNQCGPDFLQTFLPQAGFRTGQFLAKLAKLSLCQLCMVGKFPIGEQVPHQMGDSPAGGQVSD
jgi:hypothetical protein